MSSALSDAPDADRSGSERAGRGNTGNDRTLLDACASGDQRAWKQLVDGYAGYVGAIARARGIADGDRDDVIQTVFTALSKSVHSIAADAAIASWLRTTTQRACTKLLRGERGVSARADIEPALTDEMTHRLERIEDHRRLREALERLGGRCRDLLLALYTGPERNAYERAGRLLGLPHGSIGPTRRRCLAQLAELFGAEPTGRRDTNAPDS